MKTPLKVIENMAQYRDKGFLEEILSKGRIVGDFVEIDQKVYGELFGKYKPTSAKSVEKMKGLGDLVAKVAQPIAKVIDKVAGTNVQGCGGCKKRQDWLNQHVPFK